MEVVNSIVFDKLLNDLCESKISEKKIDCENKINKSLENGNISWIKFKENNIYYKSLSNIDKQSICDNYEYEVIKSIMNQLIMIGMYNKMGFGYGKDDIIITELKKKLNLTL